jgi:hypothetical protein
MTWKTIALVVIGGGIFYLAILSQPDAQRSPAATPANELQLSTGQAETEPPATPDGSLPSSPGEDAAVGSARSFSGYECSGNCSGHEAGYNWAEAHDIDDEDVCDTAGDNSNSASFAEGCKAYVNGESQDDDSAKTEDQDGENADP